MKSSYPLTIFLIVLMAGCAGTGTKNYDSFKTNIENKSEISVFILRDSSYIGSAVAMQVSLNGTQIAELGPGEMVSARVISGENNLKVKMGGLVGEEASAKFTNDGKNHNFVLARLKAGLFSAELKLTEILESAWKDEVTKK